MRPIQKFHLLGLVMGMACSRTSVDDAPRLVAADSFLDGAHNCEVLETLSESMCGDETYPVYCQWRDYSVGGSVLYLTQTPATTCNEALSTAREQADNLRCRVSNSDGDFPPFCEDQDTGISYYCERMLFCQKR
jgi:hypothetical protein